MILTESSPSSRRSLLALVRHFSIWTFTLTVSWLVVGFPVVALLVIGGSLLAVSLQSVLSTSAILVVTGGLLTANVAAILVGAVMLTAWGIYPHQVSGFWWLNPARQRQASVNFASCPLTCENKLS